MHDAPQCPHCGSPLPSEGWEGLCPNCVVRVSLERPSAAQRARVVPQSSLSETQQAAGLPQPGSEEAVDIPRRTSAASGPDVLPEHIGATIGRYKLLQQI